MSTINGTAVNFGVGGLGATATGVGTFFAQSFERKTQAEVDETRDEDGEVKSRAHYGFNDEGTLEYKIKGSSLSDAVAQTKIPQPGALLTLTSTKDASINNTVWEVQSGSSLKRTNTSCAMVTLPLKKWAGITTVAA